VVRRASLPARAPLLPSSSARCLALALLAALLFPSLSWSETPERLPLARERRAISQEASRICGEYVLTLPVLEACTTRDRLLRKMYGTGALATGFFAWLPYSTFATFNFIAMLPYAVPGMAVQTALFGILAGALTRKSHLIRVEVHALERQLIELSTTPVTDEPSPAPEVSVEPPVAEPVPDLDPDLDSDLDPDLDSDPDPDTDLDPDLDPSP